MKMPMNLAFINKINVSFHPFFGTPAIRSERSLLVQFCPGMRVKFEIPFDREFLLRVSTKNATASNPKCEVETEVSVRFFGKYI